MRAFAERRCAIAIVEVGLGGALDATNALDPVVSIITSISHDHTRILGRSLAAIATEKAGIVRPQRPALVAVQRATAARAIARVCRAAGADLLVVRPVGHRVGLALAGDHQRQNAALAIAAAKQLGAPDSTITRGVHAAVWPARYELVRGRPTVILDGAHNDASAEALSKVTACCSRLTNRPKLRVNVSASWKRRTMVLKSLKRIWRFAGPAKCWVRARQACPSFASRIWFAIWIFCRPRAKKLWSSTRILPALSGEALA